MKSMRGFISNYNTFLIDLCGVMHDGINHYPEAIEVLMELRRNGKELLLISNSPRPGSIVMKQLTTMSEDFLRFKIITPGDFFIHLLEMKDQLKEELHCLHSMAFMWNQKEIDQVSMMFPQLLATQNISEAGYILITSYTEVIEDIYQFDHIMTQAIELELPCVCVNPDLVAIHGEKLIYTSGSYAKRYEVLGGKVYYLGKPYLDFYHFALSKYNLSLDKAIAIGDNLLTDITGAHNLQIHSVLITNGIYKGVDDLDEMLNNLNIYPTYRIGSLCL